MSEQTFELPDVNSNRPDVYLPYARENKRSYKHDGFRCKVLIDYFAGKRFSGITTFRRGPFLLSTPLNKDLSPQSKVSTYQAAESGHRSQGGRITVFNLQHGHSSKGCA